MDRYLGIQIWVRVNLLHVCAESIQSREVDGLFYLSITVRCP